MLIPVRLAGRSWCWFQQRLCCGQKVRLLGDYQVEQQPDYGFQVILSNICDKDIKDSIFVGWFGHYLSEAGADV